MTASPEATASRMPATRERFGNHTRRPTGLFLIVEVSSATTCLHGVANGGVTGPNESFRPTLPWISAMSPLK